MPTYEYECENCEYNFEEVQKMADKPLKKCPHCKKNKLIKLISLPAKGKVQGDIFDEMMKVKSEAKQIARRIMKGDENAAADIFGEESNKPNSKLKTPKKLNEVKKANFKRK